MESTATAAMESATTAAARPAALRECDGRCQPEK
jgi:hypothetical protein